MKPKQKPNVPVRPVTGDELEALVESVRLKRMVDNLPFHQVVMLVEYVRKSVGLQ